MGIQKETLEFILDSIVLNGHDDFAGISMFELGNQRLRESANRLCQWLTGSTHETGKSLFSALGMRHVSADLNGLDGATPIDLSEPITDHALFGAFDVVTNIGTVEHIEGLKGQYHAFANIHLLCKPCGVMVHAVPEVGHWTGHGLFGYSEDFFRQLAENAGYSVECLKQVSYSGQGNLICAALKKKASDQFMDEAAFYLLPIEIRRG